MSEDQPKPRRKLLPASVRSPGALFLQFAATHLEETELSGHRTGTESSRFAPVRSHLSALLFAGSALEAHVVGLHHCFFAHRMRAEAVVAWRQRPLPERLADLLPKKVLSQRRRRLLDDVLALQRRVLQPPPFHVAEQIELFAPAAPPEKGAFWFGNTESTWVKMPSAGDDDDTHHPAGFPLDPLDLQPRHLVTALLILLEHAVLLDRAYRSWSEWPLSVFVGGEVRTAGEWLGVLRHSYEGPHAAYFRRIRIDLSEESDDDDPE